MPPLSSRATAACRLALIVMAVAIVGCASVPSDLHDLAARPRLTNPAQSFGSHVPPPAVVARDRDELLGILDSIHTHYAARAAKATNASRTFTVAEIIAGTIGAISSALTTNHDTRAQISEIASGVTLLMIAINAKLGLGDKSTSLRGCVATLYHGVSDIRIRYSDAALPQTDSAWTHYLGFKDSVDRAVRSSCE